MKQKIRFPVTSLVADFQGETEDRIAAFRPVGPEAPLADTGRGPERRLRCPMAAEAVLETPRIHQLSEPPGDAGAAGIIRAGRRIGRRNRTRRETDEQCRDRRASTRFAGIGSVCFGPGIGQRERLHAQNWNSAKLGGR